MICYSHPTSVQPPSFLVGARELVCKSRAEAGGYQYGIGSPALLGNRPANPELIDGGWSVWINGGFDPWYLRRDSTDYPIIDVMDGEKRSWCVPCVLNIDGGKAFRVHYGKDWKPVLTKDQAELLEYARLAREELPTFLKGNSATREEMMPRLCAWAAKAIVVANHIDEGTLQAENILDTVLVTTTLTAFSGYVEEDDASE